MGTQPDREPNRTDDDLLHGELVVTAVEHPDQTLLAQIFEKKGFVREKPDSTSNRPVLLLRRGPSEVIRIYYDDNQPWPGTTTNLTIAAIGINRGHLKNLFAQKKFRLGEPAPIPTTLGTTYPVFLQ